MRPLEVTSEAGNGLDREVKKKTQRYEIQLHNLQSCRKNIRSFTFESSRAVHTDNGAKHAKDNSITQKHKEKNYV